jgi:TolA-binding protein
MGAYAGLIKTALIVSAVVAVLLALNKITDVKADLAVARENAQKLEKGIQDQQQTIRQLQEDQRRISEINAALNTQIQLQNRDLTNLQDRFKQDSKGNPRNFGDIAIRNPAGVERAVNRGSQNAARCLEIASGSPLTEAEKNAIKLSEINRECPSLANPNYVPK